MAIDESRRLSSQDAAFLYSERPTVPFSVCSLAIYEGTIPYERFVDHIESRLPRLPRFRQRLAFVPFNIAHPTWEDDPNFDVRRHVKQASLPSPGTDEQLRTLTAKLFEPILDRAKPMWEMYLIDGLEGDRTAILSKAHHCMVDGAAGAKLLMGTMDTCADPEPQPEAMPWRPAALPSTVARLKAGIRSSVAQQVELLRSLLRGLFNPLPAFRQVRELQQMFMTTSPWLMRDAPKLPFTRKLGSDRRFAFGRMALADIHKVRAAFGGTVNDVAIAVLTGALRKYLLSHHESVDGDEPRIAIPVNVRPRRNQIKIGNRISSIVTPLPIGEQDPIKRLQAVRSRMYTLKKERQAAKIELVMRTASYAPAPLQALIMGSPISNKFFSGFNVAFSSAADIRIPLYSGGHRMMEHYAPPPLAPGNGLGAAVVRYGEDLFWSLTAEPKALPDFDEFERMLWQSFEELREAASAEATVVSAANGNGRSDGAAHRTKTRDIVRRR